MFFLKYNTEKMLTPQSFLTIVNVVCAGIGMVVGIVVARILGPELFGLLAIITGIIAVTTNFLDVRLVDLISRLYYRSDLVKQEGILDYRSSVIQVGIIAYGATSLALVCLSFLATFLTVALFTSAAVERYWLFGLALSQALRYFADPFFYLQRFSERFFLMGTFQLINSTARSVILLAALYYKPSLTGYTTGAIWAAFVYLVLAVGFSSYLWIKHDRLPIFKKLDLSAWADYLKNFRFIVLGNILGYTKLLHRAGDVLLVGLFCDDRQTGLYKLARTITDTLYVVYDAINKVYQPTFLRLLSQEAFFEYRRMVKRIMFGASSATLLVLGGEIAFLTLLLQLVFGTRYAGAEFSIIVLTIPFLFVTGFHMWLWPILVHEGQLGLYTIYSLFAAVLGQYAFGILLFTASGSAQVGCFAVSYLTFYLVLYVPMCLHVYRTHPALAVSNLG